MTRAEIFTQLKELLKYANTSADEAIDNCTEESNLRGDLGLTSIGTLYLAISIEQTFGFQFEDVSFDTFSTVKDVIDYIENKTK